MTLLATDVAPLPGGVPPEEAVADLRLACTARAIDEREMTLQKQQKVFFEISGAGHEALGLGFARALRPGEDWFFPYYRDLALALGLGVSAEAVLLQAVGSVADPSSAGRQMPSHWGDPALNIVTQSSATGSQVPAAMGCAEATTYLLGRPGIPDCPVHPGEVTYVSLGEGACSEGEVWESISAACLLRLPLVIVVADNGWAISVPAHDQAPAPIHQLLTGFPGLRTFDVDGSDYFAVRAAADEAVSWARAGNGPVVVRAEVTRPFSHSSQDTQSKYRPATELEAEAKRDPLDLLAAALVEARVLSTADVERIRVEARDDVAAAAIRALAGPRPDPLSVTDNLVAHVDIVPTEPLAGGEVLTMIDSINRTLHELMGADERIRVFGEDVADASADLVDELEGKGGVFGVTRGLQRSYGVDRCYNTPIAEAAIVGRAIGQALRGLRPCAEIQFFDYIWPAMQQIKTEAATIRWRSNGAFGVPAVIRAPIGGYLTGGSIWHSQCGESIFAHIPGLSIAFPSRAADAAGLLRAAFAIEDPVLFLEHKHLFRQAYARDPYPGPDYVIPFGVGAVRRPGEHLTLVTWGATVEKSLQAATRVEESGGRTIEVIDLRTIVPYDRDIIARSVAKTHRLLVVHEDTLTCGFGAEIAAWAGDELYDLLEAPVRRVAALDTPVPYEPTLENIVLPQVDDVAAAASALIGRAGRSR